MFHEIRSPDQVPCPLQLFLYFHASAPDILVWFRLFLWEERSWGGTGNYVSHSSKQSSLIERETENTELTANVCSEVPGLLFEDPNYKATLSESCWWSVPLEKCHDPRKTAQQAASGLSSQTTARTWTQTHQPEWKPPALHPHATPLPHCSRRSRKQLGHVGLQEDKWKPVQVTQCHTWERGDLVFELWENSNHSKLSWDFPRLKKKKKN